MIPLLRLCLLNLPKECYQMGAKCSVGAFLFKAPRRVSTSSSVGQLPSSLLIVVR